MFDPLNKIIEKQERVLIVDDNPSNLKLLSELLKENGYKIYVANNGIKCLDVCDKIKPDIVLLDINMPVLDGFETCKRLKANEMTAEIPVIFLTALREESDILKGFEMGGADYLSKPFKSQELLARLKTHLELKSKREQIVKERQFLIEEAIYSGMGDIAREVIHNIGNSLASMEMTDDLINDSLDQLEEKGIQIKEIRNLLAKQRMQTHSMLSWIQSHREVAKRSGVVINEDIGSLIYEIIARYDQQFLNSGIEVSVNVIDKVVRPILKIKFIQVINHLINNAVEAIKRSKKQIKKLALSIVVKDEDVLLYIQDSGDGILKENSNKIFERGYSTIEGKQGYGLHFCANALQEMGGTLQLQSDGDGMGTKAIVILKPINLK